MTQDERKVITSTPDNSTLDWVSTYGIMTAERVLDYYELKVPLQDLKRALHHSDNFIYHLLALPLKNVFNGIIMQQAKDYMVFGQKLFVDYLLSGETTREASSPGEGTREDLESLRQELVAHSEAFHQIEAQQIRLIYDTQHLLINTMKLWRQDFDTVLKQLKTELETQGMKSISNTQLSQGIFSLLASQGKDIEDLNHACWRTLALILGESPSDHLRAVFQKMINPLRRFNDETEAALQSLKERSQNMHIMFKEYRRDFYNYIKRINALLDNLPEYRLSVAQLEKNRQEIEFDPNFDVI